MDLMDILLLADAGSNSANDYATALAAACHAHLTIGAFLFDPVSLLAFSDISNALIVAAQDEARKSADAVAQAALKLAETRGVPASSEIITVGQGGYNGEVARLLRRFDLTVVEQAAPNAPGDRATLIELALFGSGRPALIVPYIESAMRFDRILVAWDGSEHAARALADAMPWLQRAKTVEVVTVEGAGRAGSKVSNDGLKTHLERRRIAADVKYLSSSGEVASTLLSYAFDCSADLLVMGAYGHSRLRERVLGGVTHDILASMTLPVLMSH